MKDAGAIDVLLDLACLIGDGGGQRGLIGLQVSHRALQSVDGGRIINHGLILCRGRCIGAVGCGLGVGCGLLSGLQLLVLGGEVGLEAVNLALHFLAQDLNLLFHRWSRRRLCLFGHGMFLGRRWWIAGICGYGNQADYQKCCSSLFELEIH